MPDDHMLRLECAKEFEKIRGQLKHAQDGHDIHTGALEKLADVVEESTRQGRQEHDETVRLLMGHQGQITAAMAKQSERTAIVEQSTRSAHHRLDGQNKAIWVIVTAILTIAGALIIAHLTGGIL